MLNCGGAPLISYHYSGNVQIRNDSIKYIKTKNDPRLKGLAPVFIAHDDYENNSKETQKITYHGKVNSSDFKNPYSRH